MTTVCDLNECTGCGLCVEVCPRKCIQLIDSLKNLNAVIDASVCVNCGLCYKMCQIKNQVTLRKPLFLKQGWTFDDDLRIHASSGGVASAIEKSFVSQGGYVCSCIYENGTFIYKIVNNLDELKRFAGSKYVKSDMQSAYKKVQTLLASGEKVLFVGLPCHSAALQKYISPQQSKELYTIDLICHGTPSKKILETFLEQYHMRLDKVSEIKFRSKEFFAVHTGERYVDMAGVMDAYSIAFMYALSYTDNCYHCLYATTERISDLTLGDSWGSDMPEADRKKGLSLVLCQTEKGKKLLEMTDLRLFPVDEKKAIQSNAQLRHPSMEIKQRKHFFCNIIKGKKFNYAVFCALPYYVMKQRLKGFLIRMGAKKNSGGGTE